VVHFLTLAGDFGLSHYSTVGILDFWCFPLRLRSSTRFLLLVNVHFISFCVRLGLCVCVLCVYCVRPDMHREVATPKRHSPD